MTAVELLAECQARNIVLHPNGGQLDIDAPVGALTPDVLDRLKAHKADLLAILRGDAEALQALHEAAAEREAIAWCENGPANEVDAALRTAIAGFGELWRGEGPVEVDARGGAGQDLAAAAAPRPRATAPVEWPGAAADFCLLLAPDDLPPVPFRLNAWTVVRDAGKMLRWLRGDILIAVQW